MLKGYVTVGQARPVHGRLGKPHTDSSQIAVSGKNWEKDFILNLNVTAWGLVS